MNELQEMMSELIDSIQAEKDIKNEVNRLRAEIFEAMPEDSMEYEDHKFKKIERNNWTYSPDIDQMKEAQKEFGLHVTAAKRLEEANGTAEIESVTKTVRVT